MKKRSVTKTARTAKTGQRAYKPNPHNDFESATSQVRKLLGQLVTLSNEKKWVEAQNTLVAAREQLTRSASAFTKLHDSATA